MKKTSGYRHMLIVITYFIFYLIGFSLIERIPVSSVHIIEGPLDRKIPFLPPFVIFYGCWFLLMGATLLYFGLKPERRAEYWRAAATIMIGMTGFVLFSFLYPNGHELRPEITGTDFFSLILKLIYQADTPTNILPSMHVFCTIACATAFLRDEDWKQTLWGRPFILILSILIILSTLFIKQHTLIDVISAMVCNLICYYVVYVFVPSHFCSRKEGREKN